MFLLILKTVDLILDPSAFYGFWRKAHYQYTIPLARPLLIALQVKISLH